MEIKDDDPRGNTARRTRGQRIHSHQGSRGSGLYFQPVVLQSGLTQLYLRKSGHPIGLHDGGTRQLKIPIYPGFYSSQHCLCLGTFIYMLCYNFKNCEIQH